MTSLAFPLEIALAIAAVAWPFAAGLAIVLWSKARAAERRRRPAAVEGELRAAFQSAEAQPVPDRLALLVEALEEAQALKPAPRPRAKAGIPLPTA